MNCLTIDILLLGTGKQMLPPPPAINKYLNSLGIQVDVVDTVSNYKKLIIVLLTFRLNKRNACSTYNILVEENRNVAAALFPTDGHQWNKSKN